MAVQQEIKDLIYTYYPKGLSIGDQYASSKEYHSRRQKIDEAIASKSLMSKWKSFKEKFEKLIRDRSYSLSDYSLGGGSPSFHVSVSPKAFMETDNNVLVFTIAISVISDFWAYRFMDRTDTAWEARYSPASEKERELLSQVGQIMKETFPGHRLLEEKYLSEAYDDVESSIGLKRSPSVFDLLFVDHDN
ncbi:MAG: hypothetical protein EAS52_15500 [Parapedobacter sp.]|nr:MAG: hypothetical protein EAS52_15500 [Parapedobacter sp.]